jgi:flagellar basal-body rod modification protein FlgD
MVGVKTGTKAFAEMGDKAIMRQGASQDLAMANTAAAGEFQKAFGDQAVGDVLNKIADPNWTDPTKKVRTTGSNELDKDAFFKLMLTQMKNQDPTNPMQSHEMAAQLAQFSSLEQLNNIGSGIDNLAKAQAGQGNFGALSFIGKVVSGDASKVTRAPGDTEHGFNFTLGGDASAVTVAVKDASGKTVRTMELGALKQGPNAIRWNGLMDDGLPARQGEYRFAIDAKQSSGAKVFAKSSFEGRISGVDFTAHGPMVIVNGQSIRLSDVKKIEDPSVLNATASAAGGSSRNAQASQNRTVASLGMMGQSNQASAEFVPAAPEEEVGNLDSVKMANGLATKVEEEIK